MPAPHFHPIQPWVLADGSQRDGLTYREYPVGAPYDAFFLKVWTLSGISSKPARYHIIPDGCADMVFDREAGEGTLFGTMSTPQTVSMSERVAIFGVRMAAHVMPALTGIPASAIRDATPTFGEASQPHLRAVFAETADPLTLQTSRLIETLAGNLDLRRMDERAKNIVPALLSSENSVDRASRKIGLCTRQFQRLAHRELGLSPKMLGRILRVQRSLPSLLRRDTPHALVAATHGFSDQAHMIREFADLTGYTPEYWRRHQRMSDLFNPA